MLMRVFALVGIVLCCTGAAGLLLQGTTGPPPTVPNDALMADDGTTALLADDGVTYLISDVPIVGPPPGPIAALPGLAIYFDPSDPATVFQDSGGITFAINGDPVGLIKDKSGNGCHATASGSDRPTLVNSAGVWSLQFSNATNNGMTIACTSVFNNKGYGVVFAGGKYDASADNISGFLSSVGSDGGTCRLCLGASIGGATGWTGRGRRTDTDSGQNLTQGATDVGALRSIRFDVQWANASASLYRDNVSLATSSTFQTAGNTSATDSVAVAIKPPATAGTINITHLVVAAPPSHPTSGQLNAVDSYICTSQGRTC